jgi:hypothetical protein
MAQRKPKRKHKKYTAPTTQRISFKAAKDFLVEERLKDIRETNLGRTVITDFGEIKIHPDADVLDMSKDVLGTLLIEETLAEEHDDFDEEDDLQQYLFYENLAKKFPNEPCFAHERMLSYINLDRAEKASELVIENYKKFKGYLPIDLYYGLHIYNKEYESTVEEIFGNKLNLHEIYPERTCFKKEEVAKFFLLQSLHFVEQNDLEKAEIFANYLENLDYNKQKVAALFLIIREKRNPIKLKIRKWLIIGVLISIIVGVVWGIIALIQWIIGLF